MLQAQLAQTAMGSTVAVLVYLMALRAFGLGTAVIAGLAMALAPFSLFMTTVLLTETLFTFLMAVSVSFWTRRQAVPAGLFLGAATLTRAAALPLIAAVLLVGLLLKSDRWRNLKLGLVALAIVAPWTVRNAVTMGAFIPVANIGIGANMLFGTKRCALRVGQQVHQHSFRIPTSLASWRQGRRRRTASAKWQAWPGRTSSPHSLDWLWVRLKQYPRYWLGTGYFISPHVAVKYGFVAAGAVFWVLVAAGMFLARRRWRDLYPLALFPIVTSAAHFVGSAEERSQFRHRAHGHDLCRLRRDRPSVAPCGGRGAPAVAV